MDDLEWADDLKRLDPTGDPERFAAIVSGIAALAARELADRRARRGTLWEVSRWRRPMLAAAAVMAIASATVLFRVHDAAPAAASTGVAEAIGIPDPVADWLWQQELPTAVEIYLVLDD